MDKKPLNSIDKFFDLNKDGNLSSFERATRDMYFIDSIEKTSKSTSSSKSEFWKSYDRISNHEETLFDKICMWIGFVVLIAIIIFVLSFFV